MSSWTWLEPVPSKTVPLRAVTLRLRPELLHEFDIRDLRNPSVKRAPPRPSGRRLKKPRTRKKAAIVVAEDQVQDQVEVSQESNLPAPVRSAPKRQVPSQTQRGDHDDQVKPLFNLTDWIDPRYIDFRTENDAVGGGANDNTEMDVDIETTTFSVANGAPGQDPDPRDGSSAIADVNDDSNKENIPPPIAADGYAARPVRPSRVDTDVNDYVQTFTGFDDGGPDVRTQHSNRFGESRYTSEGYRIPSYQFISEPTTHVDPAMIFSGSNNFGHDFGVANRSLVGQYAPQLNTFASAFRPTGNDTTFTVDQYHNSNAVFNFDSHLDSSRSPALYLGAGTGATQLLPQLTGLSAFVPPRPQSVVQVAPSTEQAALSFAALNTYIPQQTFHFPAGLNNHLQQQLSVNVPQVWNWFDLSLSKNPIHVLLSDEMSVEGANILVGSLVSPTVLACAHCGEYNRILAPESLEESLASSQESLNGGWINVNANSDSPTFASALTADAEIGNTADIDEVGAAQLADESDANALGYEIATAPDPFDERAERARLRKLEESRPCGNTPVLTAEEAQWKEICLDMRGAAYRMSRDRRERGQHLTNLAVPAMWETRYQDEERGRYVEAPADEDFIGAAEKTFKEVELSECEGLRISPKGTVLDKESALVAHLVTGDLRQCTDQVINEKGQVVDIAGTVIGKIKMGKAPRTDAYQLFEAKPDAIYKCNVDRVVVRKLSGLGLRRQGFWNIAWQAFQFRPGSGEHWKSIDGWKQFLQTGGKGLGQKVWKDLGLDKAKDRELSERKIKELLADKLIALGVNEEETVDASTSADMNGLFGVGDYQELGLLEGDTGSTAAMDVN